MIAALAADPASAASSSASQSSKPRRSAHCLVFALVYIPTRPAMIFCITFTSSLLRVVWTRTLHSSIKESTQKALVASGFPRLQVMGPFSGSAYACDALSPYLMGVLIVNGEADDRSDNSALDSGALIEIAGGGLSARMLETFRAEDLLPRPMRGANRGRTPTWVYPAGTDKQLLSLLGWRAHTKDPGTLRVLLWLDGFEIPTESVRNSLVRGLQAMLAVFDKELANHAERQGLDPAREDFRDAALQHFASVFAAKRGPHSLPRHARVSAADRARAVELILRLFAFGEQIEPAPREADTVERVLGVAPNGRRQRVGDADPWLTGPAEDLFDAARFVALPSALEAVRAASDADLEKARGLVATLFRYLPLMARMIGAVFGDENYAGFAGLREMDQNPEFVMLLVPMVVGMLRAGWEESLSTVAGALGPFPNMVTQAERILEMPAKTVTANLADKPAQTRTTAQRFLDAALDGQFDQRIPRLPNVAEPDQSARGLGGELGTSRPREGV